MTYKQNVRRTAHCTGGRFKLDNVMHLQRTKYHVVSFVPMSKEFPSQHFSKHGPVWCLIGPNVFNQNRNFELVLVIAGCLKEFLLVLLLCDGFILFETEVGYAFWLTASDNIVFFWCVCAPVLKRLLLIRIQLLVIISTGR